MAYIKREIESEIVDASKEYACVLLTGARQVGKSTMLRTLSDSRRAYVTLDDLTELQLAKRDPSMFLQLHPAPVLIDEVQYAPELFRVIKMIIDNGAPAGSFWLTGSQTFTLMELAQESLAGRMAVFQLLPLSQHEIEGAEKLTPFIPELDLLVDRKERLKYADITDIYKRIWNGGMPGLVSQKYTKHDLFYASYVKTYIERDVSDLLPKVEKLLFRDFIRAVACRVSSMLNVHDIAQDVGINEVTAKRWLAALEASGLIFYLRPYSNNLLKRTIKTPKVYFTDSALAAYLTSYKTPETLMNGALSGAILENYVISEIRKSWINAGIEPTFWYYRDRDAREIDLIILQDGKIYPCEIKRTSSPKSDMISAFSLLDKTEFPESHGALLCMNPQLSALNTRYYIVPIWMI